MTEYTQVLPCGCLFGHGPGGAFSITWCRLHAAAPDLLEACKVALDALGCDRVVADRLEAQKIIADAIAKAERKK